MTTYIDRLRSLRKKEALFYSLVKSAQKTLRATRECVPAQLQNRCLQQPAICAMIKDTLYSPAHHGGRSWDRECPEGGTCVKGLLFRKGLHAYIGRAMNAGRQEDYGHRILQDRAKPPALTAKEGNGGNSRKYFVILWAKSCVRTSEEKVHQTY